MTETRRMPAEWEPHSATWISWPHEVADWPGKMEAVSWVYSEIVRVLGETEKVQILCHNEEVKELALNCLHLTRVDPRCYSLHLLPTNRSWLRDSAPTAVISGGKVQWIKWLFNAWAKYDNHQLDAHVPDFIAKVSGCDIVTALRPDNGAPLVLEGGAIDTDGDGTLLVTEECLLSRIQERNPGLTREGYEKAFAEYLGIGKTIWLGQGCEGDDTHGHIDDIARFFAPGKILLACEDDPADGNHKISEDNLRRLAAATDARGRKPEVVKLPMPRPIFYGEDRLPASYANFYIANKAVIVPTFNDEKDHEALSVIRKCFPGRKVAGINCTDMILGLGTLHCLSQQQPEESLQD